MRYDSSSSRGNIGRRDGHEVRNTQVQEERLRLCRIGWEIAAEEQFVRDDRDGVHHVVEEIRDILFMSTPPGAIRWMRRTWLIIAFRKSIELLNEAVVWVDLRSPMFNVSDRFWRCRPSSLHQKSRDDGRATGDAHNTMHKNAPTTFQRILDESTCLWQVNQKVLVFRVFHRDGEMFRAC